jgi:DNA polymerase-3 subunit gamma/tau
VRYSLDSRFEVDLVISRLSYLSSWVTPAELKAAIEDARSALAGAPRAVPQTRSAAAFGGATRGSPLTGGTAQTGDTPRPFVERGGLSASSTQSAAQQSTQQVQQIVQPVIAARPSLTLQELQEAAVQALSANNTAVSSALSQTTNWKLDGDTITADIESAFLFQQLAKENAVIAALIYDLWGRHVRFTVHKSEESVAVEKTYPERVEFLRRHFKGTVSEES